MTAKKAAPRKAAPRKSPAAKKAAASRAKKAEKQDAKDEKMGVEEVAVALLDGSTQWGTGRDRDTNLAEQGYDLEEVRLAVEQERSRRLNTSDD